MNSLKNLITNNMPNNIIQELLNERETLCEIAKVMYGDMYVIQKDFWNSPTERELARVYEQLELLGHDDPITEEQQAIGEMIFDKLVDEGIFSLDDDDEDDN